MPEAPVQSPIPADVALRLCEAIVASRRGQWWTYTWVWCKFCLRFSATPETRCWANKEGNRGCSQVSARFDSGG